MSFGGMPSISIIEAAKILVVERPFDMVTAPDNLALLRSTADRLGVVRQESET
jgi:hypothetical protein